MLIFIKEYISRNKSNKQGDTNNFGKSLTINYMICCALICRSSQHMSASFTRIVNKIILKCHIPGYVCDLQETYNLRYHIVLHQFMKYLSHSIRFVLIRTI